MIIYLMMTPLIVAGQTSGEISLSPKEQVDSLNRAYFNYMYSDQDSAKLISDKALYLADSINYAAGKIRAFRNNGISASIRGEYIHSLEHFFEGVKTAKSALAEDLPSEEDRKVEFLLFDNYGGIGNTYNYMGEFKLALKYYRKARKIAEKRENNKKVLLVDFNMAIIHKELGNLDLAEEIFLNSIDKTQFDATKNGNFNAYLNLGAIYMKRENYEEAMRYCSLALDGYRSINDQVGITHVMFNMAEIYFRTNKFEEAKEIAFEALEINQQTGENKTTVDLYNVIGSAYRDLGNYELAEEYLRKCLNLSIEKDFSKQGQSACEELTTLYEATGNTTELIGIKEIHLQIQNKLLQQKDEFSVEELRIAKSLDEKIESFEIEASIFQRSQMIMLVILVLLGIELLITGYIYNKKRV